MVGRMVEPFEEKKQLFSHPFSLGLVTCFWNCLMQENTMRSTKVATNCTNRQSPVSFRSSDFRQPVMSCTSGMQNRVRKAIPKYASNFLICIWLYSWCIHETHRFSLPSRRTWNRPRTSHHHTSSSCLSHQGLKPPMPAREEETLAFLRETFVSVLHFCLPFKGQKVNHFVWGFYS